MSCFCCPRLNTCNFLAYKASKCPSYDLLHCIFAAKANVTIPYQYDSLQPKDGLNRDTERPQEASVPPNENFPLDNDKHLPGMSVRSNEDFQPDIEVNNDNSSQGNNDIMIMDIDDDLIDVDTFMGSLHTGNGGNGSPLKYKLKLLEIEKSERIEIMKIEYEYKLQLELAKLKNQSEI